ncbi:helicase [Sanguibacteroides justesenii]|uniref:DEAD/DEAH box helicase n=1 Tax=Sanguibacteroides justesenii TaxID=1547597 RepID=UPI000D8FCD49|nr:DEAD/DEAH box helicase [Sanguibacteroides justesenii]PXZ43951.1 helicase [Sanguibacteroides justesenii]
MPPIDDTFRDILQSLGIATLNEMQIQAIEAQRNNRDILLLSPTGSGKTLAFLLPLLEKLSSDKKEIQALILTPSRELALQIESVFRSLRSSYRVVCCYGGHDIQVEERSLVYPPALLIGTPGRLLDHIDRQTIDLKEVHTIILDEFDKSLEFGFIEDMREIFACLHGIRQRILTSATSAVEIPVFVGIKSPHAINFLEKTPLGKLEIKTVYSGDPDKLTTLYRLLGELNGSPTLIFCNYREHAERISTYLRKQAVGNEFFHGGLEQAERERVLCKFRNGSTTILISTDLAARGLDIPEIEYIIHYHFPDTEEAFIHRNGRTARMKASGTAFVLIGESEIFPAYLPEIPEVYRLSGKNKIPPKPEWDTLYIGKGKKDKLSKMDIVGFLCQKGNLHKEEIGRIEIKDFHAFAAIKRNRIRKTLSLIRNEKIKNMKTKFAISF